MIAKKITQKFMFIPLMVSMLVGCFNPPFNDFKPDQRPIYKIRKRIPTITQTSERAIIDELHKQAIEVIEYGDMVTVIIPTDRYYIFNTPHLNDVCYAGLNNVAELINLQACSTVYVAAFTDNVGSVSHQIKLSNAQAQTMLTFLWAKGFSAEKLSAKGYAKLHAVGDNAIIHGSAYNRRIERQWWKNQVKRHASDELIKSTK